MRKLSPQQVAEKVVSLARRALATKAPASNDPYDSELFGDDIKEQCDVIFDCDKRSNQRPEVRKLLATPEFSLEEEGHPTPQGHEPKCDCAACRAVLQRHSLPGRNLKMHLFSLAQEDSTDNDQRENIATIIARFHSFYQWPGLETSALSICASRKPCDTKQKWLDRVLAFMLLERFFNLIHQSQLQAWSAALKQGLAMKVEDADDWIHKERICSSIASAIEDTRELQTDTIVNNVVQTADFPLEVKVEITVHLLKAVTLLLNSPFCGPQGRGGLVLWTLRCLRGLTLSQALVQAYETFVSDLLNLLQRQPVHDPLGLGSLIHPAWNLVLQDGSDELVDASSMDNLFNVFVGTVKWSVSLVPAPKEVDSDAEQPTDADELEADEQTRQGRLPIRAFGTLPFQKILSLKNDLSGYLALDRGLSVDKLGKMLSSENVDLSFTPGQSELIQDALVNAIVLLANSGPKSEMEPSPRHGLDLYGLTERLSVCLKFLCTAPKAVSTLNPYQVRLLCHAVVDSNVFGGPPLTNTDSGNKHRHRRPEVIQRKLLQIEMLRPHFSESGYRDAFEKLACSTLDFLRFTEDCPEVKTKIINALLSNSSVLEVDPWPDNECDPHFRFAGFFSSLQASTAMCCVDLCEEEFSPSLRYHTSSWITNETDHEWIRFQTRLLRVGGKDYSNYFEIVASHIENCYLQDWIELSKDLEKRDHLLLTDNFESAKVNRERLSLHVELLLLKNDLEGMIQVYEWLSGFVRKVPPLARFVPITDYSTLGNPFFERSLHEVDPLACSTLVSLTYACYGLAKLIRRISSQSSNRLQNVGVLLEATLTHNTAVAPPELADYGLLPLIAAILSVKPKLSEIGDFPVDLEKRIFTPRSAVHQFYLLSSVFDVDEFTAGEENITDVGVLRLSILRALPDDSVDPKLFPMIGIQKWKGLFQTPAKIFTEILRVMPHGAEKVLEGYFLGEVWMDDHHQKRKMFPSAVKLLCHCFQKAGPSVALKILQNCMESVSNFMVQAPVPPASSDLDRWHTEEPAIFLIAVSTLSHDVLLPISSVGHNPRSREQVLRLLSVLRDRVEVIPELGRTMATGLDPDCFEDIPGVNPRDFMRGCGRNAGARKRMADNRIHNVNKTRLAILPHLKRNAKKHLDELSRTLAQGSDDSVVGEKRGRDDAALADEEEEPPTKRQRQA